MVERPPDPKIALKSQIEELFSEAAAVKNQSVSEAKRSDNKKPEMSAKYSAKIAIESDVDEKMSLKFKAPPHHGLPNLVEMHPDPKISVVTKKNPFLQRRSASILRQTKSLKRKPSRTANLGLIEMTRSQSDRLLPSKLKIWQALMVQKSRRKTNRERSEKVHLVMKNVPMKMEKIQRTDWLPTTVTKRSNLDLPLVIRRPALSPSKTKVLLRKRTKK